MKFLILFSFIIFVINATTTFDQNKAELIRILNQDAKFHSSSSESRERRRIRRLGYYEYCLRFRNRYACRNNQNRYRNRYDESYPYRNPYYYNYYYTTTPPFPFNLFGRKK